MNKWCVLFIAIAIPSFLLKSGQMGTAVEQQAIKHGRDAAMWCVTTYADQLEVGDFLSVVRSRDDRGNVVPKVSYVGQVVDNKGVKTLKKIAS